MKTFLELRLETGNQETVGGFNTLRALASASEIHLKPIRVPGLKSGDAIPAGYWNAIESASGFYVGHPHLLSDRKTRTIVEEKLAAGATLVADVRLSGSSDPPGMDFFRDLGIDPTSIGAFPPPERNPHPTFALIEIDRTNHNNSFRDTRLFRGVEKLVLQASRGLGCAGHAQVALALPASAINLVDVRTDLFAYGFAKPELPVAAIAQRDSWSGQVIALSAGLLHDRYIGPMGDEFPGIEASDNTQFAKNIIRLVQGGPPEPSDTWDDVYNVITSIEYNLCYVMQHALKHRFGEGWFETGVPADIRGKCMTKMSQERKGFPAAAYMDVVDYEKVWRTNWDLLSLVYEPNTSKNVGTKFLGRLNEIRKLAMHPTKQVLGERLKPTLEELSEVRDYARAVIRQLEKARTLWPLG